jgi:flagellin
MAAGSILNNISAINASRTLGITGQGMDKTIGRLTTGMRINKASDDAAGLAISNRLGADIRISAQARRNAYDGIAYLAVADGALEEVTQLLTRAAELTQQAATGTISASNRAALDLEFQVIKTAITNVNDNAMFNGQSVFVSGGGLFVALAGFTSVSIDVGAMDDETLMSGLDITNSANAVAAAATLDEALQLVSMQRATLGSQQQALNTMANTLGIQVENFTAANSQIRDANIADEVINLTKFQILTQSGTSALGQSNQAAQMILGLLR